MANVLLVDDEPETAEIIQMLFESKGFPCRVAKNSDEALKNLEEQKPDMTFLDIQLKNSTLDGFGILREGRKFLSPGAKVYMVTGFHDAGKEAKSKELGADGYLVKPITVDKLLEILKNFDSQKP